MTDTAATHGTRRWAVPALALATLTATLGACGGSGSSSNGEAGKPASQVLADAKAATNSTTSVRVAGSGSSSGSAIQIDLVAGHGAGGGSIGEGGGSFMVVTAAGKVYLRADQATWTKLANAAVAALIADKWIYAPSTDSDYAQLAQLTDITQLTSQLVPSGTLTEGKVTSFHGQSAVPLVDSGGSQGTLYVAATGKPYILGVTKAGSDGGSILFTQYGTAKAPPAPAGAIDIQSLSSGG